MVELKRIGVMSVAKLQAVIMAVAGLLMGLGVAFFGMIGAMIPGADVGMMGMSLGLVSIIAVPVGYAIIGFVSGAIGAVLYNLFAGLVGGITLELSR
jgi:hypothetical protein